MQADDVGFLQQPIERAAPGLIRPAGALCNEYVQAKGAGDVRHGPAELAVADDAQCAAAEFVDGIVEQAEMLRRLPVALLYGTGMAVQPVSQGQHRHEHMFDYRGGGIGLHIADRDAVTLRCSEVDVVGAGCSDTHQLQAGGGG